MRRDALLLLALAHALFAPGDLLALSPPHDESNTIDCYSCHAPHGGALLPTGEAQEIMCRTCHNPTGQAASMPDVANHVVDDEATTVDCGSCHDPHQPTSVTDPHAGGITADNLSLLRDDVEQFVPAALYPAVLQTTPDHYAFEEGDPPWVGSCQVCHTATHHHTNDGSGDHDHQIGTTCTSCHPHEEGFMPTGGCTDCHAVAQGSRRQIVDVGGDFERSSHHVQTAIDDDDCVACHYTGGHQAGTVVLRDPDDGVNTTYDYDPATPAGVEDFCVGCHDGDGALALDTPMQPFTDGQAPPDVWVGGLWDDAAHNVFGHPGNNDQPVSCMGDGTTTGCHGNAHGSDNEKLLAAAAGVALDDFCFQCHTEGVVANDALANNRPGSYVSSDDIEEAFGMSTTHSLDYAWEYGGDTFSLQCTSCHNPHVASGGYWDAEDGRSPVTRPDLTDPVGNPRAMGTTLWGDEPGEKMDDFAASGSGSGGWFYSTARGGAIVGDQGGSYRPPKSGSGYDQEFDGADLPDYTSLCLDCHTYRVNGDIPPVNWGQPGVTCTGNGVDPPDQRVECGAQHGLGAANKPYWVSDDGTSGFWGTSGNPDVIFSMNYVTRGRHNGHFMRWPYDSAERAANINFVMSCTDCHEAHGSPRGGMIRERFNVNANGDCGTGGDVKPNGENCTDGGNWNSFCNACHYYYGGHHAGMSCGNASCHEANSIHRIIHNTSSGGTQLMITASGWESYFVQPDFTPDIVSVEGDIGSDELEVVFAEGVYNASDLTGALDAEDFWLFDHNGDNPRSLVAVDHVEGEDTAILTMGEPLIEADLHTDTVAMRPASAWCWYDGGYVNWATGTLAAMAVSAGPWPAAIAGSLEITQVEGAVGYDQVLVTFSTGVFSNGDGTGGLQPADFVLTDADDGRSITSVLHTAGGSSAILTLDAVLDASDDLDVDSLAAAAGSVFGVDGFAVATTAVTLTGNDCPVWGTSFEMNEAAGTATVYDAYGLVEGAVSNPAVSMVGNGAFHGDEDENTYVNYEVATTCLSEATRAMTLETRFRPSEVNLDYGIVDRTATSQTVWWRYSSWLLRVLRADWWGDDVDPSDSARLIVKYRAADNHGGSNWKQVVTDIDTWPLTRDHWYQVRVVFNSDKLGILEDTTGVPIDIFVDDQGTDGMGMDELWSGYVNASFADPYESADETYVSYPGDEILQADGAFRIGSNSDGSFYMFNGDIDWVLWLPYADYTGVDDPPN